MFTIQLLDLGSIPIAGVGGTLIVRMTKGWTYDSVNISHGLAADTTSITQIRVVLNGDIIQRFQSFADLNNWASEKLPVGNTTISGNTTDVNISFAQRHMKTIGMQKLTSLYTAQRLSAATNGFDTGPEIFTAQIEIDYGAGYTSTTVPVCTAEVSRDIVAQSILRRDFQSFSIGASLLTQINWQNKQDPIAMLEFQSALIIEMHIYQDQTKTFHRTLAQNDFQLSANDRTPIASQFTIDPSEYGDANQIIATTYATPTPANPSLRQPYGSLIFELVASAAINSLPVACTYYSSLRGQ